MSLRMSFRFASYSFWVMIFFFFKSSNFFKRVSISPFPTETNESCRFPNQPFDCGVKSFFVQQMFISTWLLKYIFPSALSIFVILVPNLSIQTSTQDLKKYSEDFKYGFRVRGNLAKMEELWPRRPPLSEGSASQKKNIAYKVAWIYFVKSYFEINIFSNVNNLKTSCRKCAIAKDFTCKCVIFLIISNEQQMSDI